FDLPPNLNDPTVISSGPAVTTGAGGLSSVQFTFSKAMNTTSFSLVDDINTFTGPGAVNLKPALSSFSWSPNGQVLTVNFAARTAAGTSTMSIGPNILSADNSHAMNQDGDGVIGEA